MNLVIVFQEGDNVLIGVFLSLLVMSVLTWYLILSKSLATYRWRRQNRQFLKCFWDAQTPREAWQQASQHLQAPLARLANTAFSIKVTRIDISHYMRIMYIMLNRILADNYGKFG